MTLLAKFNDSDFGVGDTVRVHQMVNDEDQSNKASQGDKTGKKRVQIFEGIVIGIRGREENKSFTVRRIGVQQVGIERIFPLSASTIKNIEVVKHGLAGVKRSKLYFIRAKSKKEIEKIYSRQTKKRAIIS